MPLWLEWEGGGQAQVLSIEGARLRLRSSRSAAPGQPLRARVASAPQLEVRVKVRSCRREETGTFALEARWLDLPASVRRQLERFVGDAGPRTP
jgi:hypothetical protein